MHGGGSCDWRWAGVVELRDVLVTLGGCRPACMADTTADALQSPTRPTCRPSHSHSTPSLPLPQVRSLSETVRLDARTKLLNPKWYEGMLSSGYEGVREIQKRLTNTMGWSATSGQVDNWVYDEANATFIEDPDMAKRLMETNPSSFRKLVATFLEANGRGYWDASEDQIERLKQLYMNVEDKIEGVE